MANNDGQKKIILVYDSIEHEADSAYLFSFGDKAVWLPKSEVFVSSIDMTVMIPLWLAIKEEIEMYEE